jgi:hypothetical protein
LKPGIPGVSIVRGYWNITELHYEEVNYILLGEDSAQWQDIVKAVL